MAKTVPHRIAPLNGQSIHANASEAAKRRRRKLFSSRPRILTLRQASAAEPSPAPPIAGERRGLPVTNLLVDFTNASNPTTTGTDLAKVGVEGSNPFTRSSFSTI